MFLHDRPLSSGGQEIVEKITKWMKRTPDTAPLVTEPPLPPARAYLVFGWNARRKFFPEIRGGPGAWLKAAGGAYVMITYSPEHLLLFSRDSREYKAEYNAMVGNLKAFRQRMEGVMAK